MSPGSTSIRATAPWCRTRTCRTPSPRTKLSARAIRSSASTDTGVPYGMRDDRHACAGLSHVASPMVRESSRTSAFPSPASTSGDRTPWRFAAFSPGLKSPRSSTFAPLATNRYPSSSAMRPSTEYSSSLQK